MAYEIVVDARAATAKLDHMQRAVSDLQTKMADEFVAWQAQDMKRKRPSFAVTGGGNRSSVETLIYPRARTFLVSSAQRARAQRRLTFRPKSSRPILRAVLYQMLIERMRDMLRSVSWR